MDVNKQYELVETLITNEIDLYPDNHSNAFHVTCHYTDELYEKLQILKYKGFMPVISIEHRNDTRVNQKLINISMKYIGEAA
jgi:hypothetical protein